MGTPTSPCPRRIPTSPPHPHRRVLQQLRRALWRPRQDHVQHGGRQGVREADGAWTVTLEGGETRRYDAVMVANGHHWNARWPEPPFPGDFDGEVMHSHYYVDNEPFKNKNVVVLGMGNSAMDIAVESSFVAGRTFLAARRGAWIIPKYLGGRPLDQQMTNPRIPFAIKQRLFKATIGALVGAPEKYGLPRPDHELGQAHPTVSSDILSRLVHGEITPKPNIVELMVDRGEVRGWLGGTCRRDRLLHRVQGDVSVLRRRLSRRAGQRPTAVPPRLQARHGQPLLHRPAAAAGRYHAAGRGPVAVGRRVPAWRLRAPQRQRPPR